MAAATTDEQLVRRSQLIKWVMRPTRETLKEFGAAIKGITAFIEQMDAKNKERNDKIAKLEAKLASLESEIKSVKASSIKYCGVWSADVDSYSAGDAVTHSGGLWIAKAATRDRPGQGATAWRLAVKSGAR